MRNYIQKEISTLISQDVLTLLPTDLMNDVEAVHSQNTPKKKGLFIVFEGIDASGKSTQAELTYDWLQELGIPCIKTREPGGTEIGTRIREMILAGGSEMDIKTELLLFLVDRVQHIKNVIQPALDRGQVVICDRYEASTMAYQVFGRKQPLELVRTMNKYATGGLSPDVTYFLDVNAYEAWERIKQRDNKPNHFDKQDYAFRQRLIEGYKFQINPSWKEVNADNSVEVVHTQITNHLADILRKDAAPEMAAKLATGSVACPICMVNMVREPGLWTVFVCPNKHGRMVFTRN